MCPDAPRAGRGAGHPFGMIIHLPAGPPDLQSDSAPGRSLASAVSVVTSTASSLPDLTPRFLGRLPKGLSLH